MRMKETRGFRGLRSKLIVMLSIVAASMLCLVPFASSFAVSDNSPAGWMEGYAYKQFTDYGGTPSTFNGLQFDGGKMPLGMFGQNFFLGYDDNGNFAVERSSGTGAESGYGPFDVVSGVKAYADGFSTTFSFNPNIDRGAPEEGGAFAIGLGDGSQNPYAFMYIVFRYNGTDLDMYLLQYGMAHGYNVADGVHSCYNKANLVELSTLATREFSKPKLNEKITLQLKKITKEEADIYNADPRTTTPVTMDGLDKEGKEAPTTGKTSWRWIVNGVVIETPAFSEAQQKGPMFDAYSLPKDENGDYYGYLWADCNFRSGGATFLLSSSNIGTNPDGTYKSANLSGRLTFYDIVTDGSAGGATIAAPLPGTTPGAATGDYTYAAPAAGPNKGKTTISSEGAYSLQYENKVKLNALELRLDLKKIDQPNGGSYRVLFKETSAPGTWANGVYTNDDAYFGLIFKKTAWRSMAVSLLLNGREYPTVYTEANPLEYDFKNGGELVISLFAYEDSTFFLFNGQNVEFSTELTAALSEFSTDAEGKPEGYLYLQNDAGASRLTIVDQKLDGTAVPKTMVVRVNVPGNVTVVYGAAYTNPEKVEVFFDDGTEAEWQVTWSIAPDTTSSQTYDITGKFTDFDTLDDTYFIPSSIINSLAFKVTVNLDPAFVHSDNLGTGYDKTTNQATIGPEGYRWYSVYSVRIPYLYKQDEGYKEHVDDNGKYEHLMSDPSQANRQFHSSDLVRKDVNGYELEFAIKNHTPATDPDVYIMLTATPGHPEQIGQGNVGLHFVPTNGQTKMYANLVTWMQGAVGGLPEGASIDAEAYFQKEGEAPVREIDFDFTGKTMYRLTWKLSGEEGHRKVDMVLETPDGKYAVVDKDGNHIGKADYQFNADHIATPLEPNGKFENEKGYLFVWVERGYNEIIFRQHYNEYVASYDKPSAVEVPNNTSLAELGLPETVTMKTNKNVFVTGTVVYSGYDPALLGIQEITGTVTPPAGYAFEDNVSETFTLQVTVKGMISSVSSPQADITIRVGESLTLPTKFHVILNGGTEKEISFMWLGEWDALTPGEYELTAVPLDFYDYADGVSPMKVKITVTAPEKAGGCACNSSNDAAGIAVLSSLALAVFVFKRKLF